MTEINIKLGGAAGQGLHLSGHILSKAFVRGGFHVFAIQDAMSRIRGGHNFFQLRVKDSPVAAMTSRVNLLVALDQASLALHQAEVADNGLVILDSATLKTPADGPNMVDLPMKQLALDKGGKALFANTAALGFIAGLLELGLEQLAALFEESFPKEDLAQKNLAVAEAGHALATDALKARIGTKLKPRPGPKRMFLNGNEAVALGAVAADVRLMSAYPMSPSTGIITNLARVEDEVGIVTEQAEDEIAAVNMAFGAAMAGVRAMTATSGGGMALMSETISLSGAAEVPLVIVDCQRPGPATGLPTRTDQSDLLFSIYTGHGEFARAVLAPGNAEEAFFDTVRAFNLAERYQIPVILLSEQYLADSYYTVDPFDLDQVTSETSLLSDDAAASLPEYKRYAVTGDGVSPRLYPGQSDHLVLSDSHEHDETGHISEEAANRARMVEKRLRKIETVTEALATPKIVGKADAETVVMAWGTAGEPVKEALAALAEQGVEAALVHFRELWPFPEARVNALLAHEPRLLVVEGNAWAQLKQIVAQHTGRKDIETLLRYDGRPFMADELAVQLKERLLR
jgi:2-oxoglutarate ferredoxin oxidoreductase subunit alpha